MLLLCLLLFQPQIQFGPARDKVVAGPFDAPTASLRLQLFVSDDCQDLAETLPMLGRSFWRADQLVFAPSFPLQQGVNYCACLMDEHGTLVTQAYQYKPSVQAQTYVRSIYPSAAVLPANHLRFYIYFSAPMMQGQAFEHIELLREDGSVVEKAFFEDRAELWDPERMRFTLHFDPGRVKRGLRYREELGPILEQGQTYTLVIKASWPDGNGQALASTIEKRFLAGPADYAFPERDSWQVQWPAINSREPLVIRFPQPLDYGLLQHAISLRDPQGATIAGSLSVSDQEQAWSFTPATPWQAKPKIEVDAILADPCGNSIEAPFERYVD